jgi:Zn-dependent protease
LFGIQIRLDYSWFLIFALLTIFLVWQVFPSAVIGETTMTYWVMSVVTALLFFGSVLVHEFAHSLVGQAEGIPVRKINLNIFGGAAQLDRDPPTAGAEIKMAIAGPMASLLLAIIFYAVYDFYLSHMITLAAMALWLAQINLIIAAFNMLPGFPMDGGRVIRAIWWKVRGDYNEVTRKAITVGRIVGWGVVVAGVFFIAVYQDWIAGVWLGIIGLFLEYTARTSRQQFELQLWLKARLAGDLVRKNCRRVEHEAVNNLNPGNSPGVDCLLVEQQGRLIGILIGSGTVQDNSDGNSGEIIPMEKIPNVSSQQDLLETVRLMNESGLDVVTVDYDGDNLTGLVILQDMIALVNDR